MPYHHLEILWISCLRLFKCQLLNQAYIKGQGRLACLEKIPTIAKKKYQSFFAGGPTHSPSEPKISTQLISTVVLCLRCIDNV